MRAQSRRKQPATTARTRGRVLLVAEESTAPWPQQRLEAEGLEIVGTTDGAAALLSLQRLRPHVVIASIKIKEISPRELGRMLAQTENGVPLILVGAEVSTLALRLEALSSGAFDYFSIPSESELLVLRTGQLVHLKQAMDRLHSEAGRDYLTGLANRRHFRLELTREVERWRRYGVPCALLLLDIDYLKAINDRFGHPAGDLVIRQVANTLAEVSRDNDTAARLGGEEFALLLAGTGVEQAARAAERLRSILAGLRVPEVGHFSVSIGVAACPGQADSERTLYTASDTALYVAKNGGRNRVAIAPPMNENLTDV